MDGLTINSGIYNDFPIFFYVSLVVPIDCKGA